MIRPSVTGETSWTIGGLLRVTTEYLQGRGVDEPRLAAEILLAHVMGCARIQLYTRFDAATDEVVRDCYRGLVRRAGEQTPIAYLVGKKEFYSLTFDVTPDVLIPRPETESLVERAVEFCRGAGGPVQMLDVGTGSGCIVITVLTRVPDAIGAGTDVSGGALHVARGNAERHGVDDRLQFIEADGLMLPPGVIPEGGFDLIVSNPPYVADDEMETLPACVRDHEPREALTPGGDGLAMYRALASGAPELLRANGALLVEIGAGKGESVRGVFIESGRFAHAGTYRGGSDAHDRVLEFVVT